MHPESARADAATSEPALMLSSRSVTAAASSISDAVENFRRQLQATDPMLVAFDDCLAPMVVCDPTLPDNPLVYVNAAFEKMTGFAAAEVLGRNCRFMQGPLTERTDVDRLGQAVRRHEKIELDLVNHRRDGSRFLNRLMVSPVFDEAGEIRWFVASQFDVTAERRGSSSVLLNRQELEQDAGGSDSALAERETRLTLALALEAGSLGTWTFNPSDRVLATSDGCKAIFGRSPEQSLTFGDFLSCVHPGDLAHVQAAMIATIEHDAPYDLEYRIITPAGEQRWVQVQAALRSRVDGATLSLSGFARDISIQKFAEEHRAVLSRELTHRVKNTLATVSAVVGQTLRDASSLEDARKAVAGRIASLATAHDLLVEGEVEGAAISDIVARVLAPFLDRHGERFSIEGPPVRLSPELTLALSMTIYEMATNAIKYGALSNVDGRVTIVWAVLGPAEQRCFSFSWNEQGGPPITPPSRPGFGTKMIERVLARHVRGEPAISYAAAGLSFSFEAII